MHTEHNFLQCFPLLRVDGFLWPRLVLPVYQMQKNCGTGRFLLLKVGFMSACAVHVSNHHRACTSFCVSPELKRNHLSCVQVEAGTSDGAITADEVGSVKSANSVRAANDKAGGLRLNLKIFITLNYVHDDNILNVIS